MLVLATGTADNDLTLTNTQSITFTKVRVTNKAASGDRLFSYVANSLVTSGQAVSQTVTADMPADAATGTVIFVFRVSGMTRTGLAAVRQQSGKGNASIPGDNPPTPDAFGVACLTGNPLLGFLANATNPAGITPPTNFTEPASGDLGYATPTAGAEVCFRDSGFTGTSVSWGNSASNFGCQLLELDTSDPDRPGGMLAPLTVQQAVARAAHF